MFTLKKEEYEGHRRKSQYKLPFHCDRPYFFAFVAVPGKTHIKVTNYVECTAELIYINLYYNHDGVIPHQCYIKATRVHNRKSRSTWKYLGPIHMINERQSTRKLSFLLRFMKIYILLKNHRMLYVWTFIVQLRSKTTKK